MSLRVRRTLGQMVDGGHTAMAECATCRGHQDIDLAKLIAKVGREYSLWNRRSPCRLTPGCTGFMVYRAGPGWPHLMADDDVEMWWVFNPIGG
jgi:hypothetical protein